MTTVGIPIDRLAHFLAASARLGHKDALAGRKHERPSEQED